jgi:hypothetical protein
MRTVCLLIALILLIGCNVPLRIHEVARGQFKELDLANEESDQHPVGMMRMARIHTELGEKDRAFE